MTPDIPAPHALLFDLDGTLVDSLRDIANALNAVLEHRGLPVHPVEAYRYFVGDGMRKLIRRAHPNGEALSEEEVEDWVQAMQVSYAKHWRTHCVPYPGIRSFLEQMKTQGLPMGILSNKPEAFTQEMVAHVFPDIPWQTVRGARDGVPVKPAPDAGREILQEWGRTPEQIWYVGDTRTDMGFAHALGCTAIGVSWGFRDRKELIETGAQRVVDHPDVLTAEIFEKINSGVTNRDPS